MSPNNVAREQIPLDVLPLDEQPLQPRRFQFTIQRLLWAMLWIGIGLALWRVTRPFDVQHFLDNDGDNVAPRSLAALYMVPVVGAVGALFGRPVSVGLIALVAWVPFCLLIVGIALLRLF